MLHHKLSIAVGTLALGSLLGCAHAEKEQVTETKPAAAVATQPAAKEDNRTDFQRMVEGTVLHFEFNKDRLTQESQERLQKIAAEMRAHADVKIKISGNCDERGTQEYNLALGQRRAEVAKQYLLNSGVTAERISTLSYGDQKPVDTRHSEDAWAANRRDDIEPIVRR